MSSPAVRLIKELGPIKIGFIVLSALIVAGAFIALAVRLSHPATVQLFSELQPEDSAKIVTALERMGTYYEPKDGGASIYVPVNKVLPVRMQLAEQGLPASGATVGYEIFDREDSLGVSNFVYNVNLVRALEGELGRTIAAFDKVANARVHLVLPRKDLFARSREEPSASVVLQMRGIQPLSRSEIDAISHLVATAAPGLEVQRITIVDTKGRPFKKGAEDPDSPDYIASAADEHRVTLERRLKRTVESLLERSVGAGRVEAQITADIDFDREIRNIEQFDPEGQVARSVQNSESRESNTNRSGDQVSVETNLPAEQDAAESAGSESEAEKLDSVTNFEVSKTTSRYVKGVGAVKRLSIAVMVDGIYTMNDETDEYDYTARSDEDLAELETLAKNAVGFNAERGDTFEMVNMRFSRDIQGLEPELPFEWIKRDLGSIVQTLMVGIVITLIIVLLIRPIVSRAFELGKNDKDEEALMNSALTDRELEELKEITASEEQEMKNKTNTEEGWLSLDKFEDNIKDSSFETVNEIIDRHPTEALTVLRNWLETSNN